MSISHLIFDSRNVGRGIGVRRPANRKSLADSLDTQPDGKRCDNDHPKIQQTSAPKNKSKIRVIIAGSENFREGLRVIPAPLRGTRPRGFARARKQVFIEIEGRSIVDRSHSQHDESTQ